MLQIYNTLTRQKEIFKPMQPGKISMYVCGITVYDYCHIGHARVLVAFDVITRFLRSQRWDVNYVRNITDIDDKIIKRANENGEEYTALTKRFIDYMHEDEARLGIERPDIEPRATGFIDGIIDMNNALIEKGHAYAASNGDVYYRVTSFKDYGKLTNKNVDELLAGARIEVDEVKEDARDCVLWKAAKAGEPAWQSPWGNGRPGWHIECSAMSLHYLDEFVDIHLGGIDLRFPHHENERAQSNSSINKEAVALWVHGEHLLFEGRKMAKSTGNVVLVSDLISKHLDPLSLRLCFLENRYRSQMDLSWDSLKAAHLLIQRWRDKTATWAKDKSLDKKQAQGFIDEISADFSADLDTPRALQKLRSIEKAQTLSDGVKYEIFKCVDDLFGLDLLKPSLGKGELTSDAQSLFDQRQIARNNADFTESDRLRGLLLEVGVVVRDSKDGQSWEWLI